MRTILYNNDNLKEENINNIVRRAKILIINSNNEILLAHADNNFFLIGGRVEDGESFEEGMVRELMEETGIQLTIKKIKPFFIITYMSKDYPSDGINTKSIANYYFIKCDIEPDLSKVSLTEDEKMSNFELRYIHRNNILDELNKCLKVCTRTGVVRDTIDVVTEYLNI